MNMITLSAPRLASCLNYMATDPSATNLRSSAAECGNNGLGRIRKTVHHLSQEHAIFLTNVFINVWNRKRLLGMRMGNSNRSHW